MQVAHDSLISVFSGWQASALLTAAMVYALQRLLRSRGGEFAGLVASAPLTSAPALLWLAQARGEADAAVAATAGMHLTAIVALVLLTVLNLVPRSWLTAYPHDSAAPATGVLPDAWCALCAGMVTGACLAAGPALSATASGLVACLPWTSLCSFTCAAWLHGPARATRFLVGYAQGLAPRLVFFGSVGLTLPTLGGPLAMLLGLTAGGATLALQRGVARLALPWFAAMARRKADASRDG